jgi:hypothetical protein
MVVLVYRRVWFGNFLGARLISLYTWLVEGAERLYGCERPLWLALVDVPLCHATCGREPAPYQDHIMTCIRHRCRSTIPCWMAAAENRSPRKRWNTYRTWSAPWWIFMGYKLWVFWSCAQCRWFFDDFVKPKGKVVVDDSKIIFFYRFGDTAWIYSCIHKPTERFARGCLERSGKNL